MFDNIRKSFQKRNFEPAALQVFHDISGIHYCVVSYGQRGEETIIYKSAEYLIGHEGAVDAAKECFQWCQTYGFSPDHASPEDAARCDFPDYFITGQDQAVIYSNGWLWDREGDGLWQKRRRYDPDHDTMTPEELEARIYE